MVRGGARPGSGRNPIDGKELKIKVSNDVIEQLDLFFPGRTSQDRIRECLEYGIKKKENEHHLLSKEKLNVVDLFSGAGGLSRGFMDASFNVVLGIDFDDAALKTFKENHGDAEIMKLDLFNHDNLHFVTDYLDEKEISIDVLIGGPPCQGYSLAGPRNENDERNSLYEAMVKLANMIKPKVVVLENVPGLLKLFDGKAAQRIVEDFSELGYVMQKKILFAPEFGVPQIRKRVFFVGVLPEFGKFSYPSSIIDKDNFITCEDAISDLPSLKLDLGKEIMDYTSRPLSVYQEVMRMNSNKLFNHVGTNHEQKTIDLISMVPEGKNFRALPSPYNTMFKYNEALTRYHSKKPSLTINTGHRSHFHYKWNRIPTVRESARLQSFPDDFIFYGNKSQQYKQVGNAVPPLLGKAIAIQVQKILTGERKQNV
ncbi:DNA cytosine methyltransferase [Carnobacterium divergens]|uniref:DNA cytosine methyltransferase n=1 Tax=Carnobacterium divergens TaxID=2748 RepID=UPI0039C95E12